MAAFNTKCPHCGIELQMQDEWIGYDVTCPSCNKTLTVKKHSLKHRIVWSVVVSAFLFVAILVGAGIVLSKYKHAAQVREMERIAKEKNIAEEKRLAEEKRKTEEKREAEKKRLAEEKRKAEEKRIADGNRNAAILTGAFGFSFGDKLNPDMMLAEPYEGWGFCYRYVRDKFKNGRCDGKFHINPPSPSPIFKKYEVCCNESGEIYKIIAETAGEVSALGAPNTEGNFKSLQMAINEKYKNHFSHVWRSGNHIRFKFGTSKEIYIGIKYYRDHFSLCKVVVEYTDFEKEKHYKEFCENARKEAEKKYKSNRENKIKQNKESLKNVI